MATSDSSIYTLRFNEVTQSLEYVKGTTWTAVPTAVASTPAVQSTLTAVFTTSSATYVAVTGLSNALAVSSLGHKVKLTVSGLAFTNGVENTEFNISMFVDGVDIAGANTPMVDFSAGTAIGTFSVPICYSILYTPADATSHTYTVRIKSAGGNSVKLGYNNDLVTFITEDVA